MDMNSLKSQVAKWAAEAGASKERANEYGVRATKAFEQVMIVGKKFSDHFGSKVNPQLSIDDMAASDLVLSYNRELLLFKHKHGISPDDRLDTHICAGLWFGLIIQKPIFGSHEDQGENWNAANEEVIARYWRTISMFAFYFAFMVL